MTLPRSTRRTAATLARVELVCATLETLTAQTDIERWSEACLTAQLIAQALRGALAGS